MSESQKRHVSEQESMAVAEASREKRWLKPSFLKELFMGSFRLDLIHPFPLDQPRSEWRPEFAEFYDAMRRLLVDDVDSVEIDRTGLYPDHVVAKLRELGAFGMKIPARYGGLGFTNAEYQRVIQLVGSVDGRSSSWLAASTAASARCFRPISRSACRSRSSCSAAKSSSRNTCPGAPGARSRPSR
jgi:hypothetical protein